MDEKRLSEYTKDLTPEQASEMASQDTYNLMWFLEYLECEGLIYGNGHHFRQYVAEYVKREVYKRWKHNR